MIDKMFEMPVPCCRCDKIIELTDCNFPYYHDNTYGVCNSCLDAIKEADE